MDPPEHFRLRRLLGRSFTPRAVARLEQRIRGYARSLRDRVLAGERGECDLARGLAADLPLLTLADVLGVPEQDRWLLFDWSNRVIGYQDPDYASSAEFDSSGGTPMAREAVALRPAPDSRGRMPDPRTREGMPDLYTYAHLVLGHGPHFCLGAHLARTQMAALLREVLARTSTLSYAGEPSYLRSNFQRGVKRLPIAWSAA
jgi:cytochrome P450